MPIAWFRRFFIRNDGKGVHGSMPCQISSYSSESQTFKSLFKRYTKFKKSFKPPFPCLVPQYKQLQSDIAQLMTQKKLGYRDKYALLCLIAQEYKKYYSNLNVHMLSDHNNSYQQPVCNFQDMHNEYRQIFSDLVQIIFLKYTGKPYCSLIQEGMIDTLCKMTDYAHHISAKEFFTASQNMQQLYWSISACEVLHCYQLLNDSYKHMIFNFFPPSGKYTEFIGILHSLAKVNGMICYGLEVLTLYSKSLYSPAQNTIVQNQYHCLKRFASIIQYIDQCLHYKQSRANLEIKVAIYPLLESLSCLVKLHTDQDQIVLDQFNCLLSMLGELSTLNREEHLLTPTHLRYMIELIMDEGTIHWDVLQQLFHISLMLHAQGLLNSINFIQLCQHAFILLKKEAVPIWQCWKQTAANQQQEALDQIFQRSAYFKLFAHFPGERIKSILDRLRQIQSFSCIQIKREAM